jgi:hypothetical protein
LPLSNGVPWVDSTGDSCAKFEANNWCAQYGDGFENGGYTANQACCACGGGGTGAPESCEVEFCVEPDCSGTYPKCNQCQPGFQKRVTQLGDQCIGLSSAVSATLSAGLVVALALAHTQ